MTASRSFSVLLSHSNRPVDFAQCSLDVLTRRYADPRRLDNLTALETLPALDTLRHFPAGLTLLTLTLDAGRATLEPVATFDPPKLTICSPTSFVGPLGQSILTHLTGRWWEYRAVPVHASVLYSTHGVLTTLYSCPSQDRS